MSRVKDIWDDTKDVFRSRWDVEKLIVNPKVILFVLWVTIARCLAYGLELVITVSTNPISPLLSYADILGVGVWGWMMVISLALLIVGILIRNTMTVTFGALACMAVWFGFMIIMGIGWYETGTGGRFFINALCNALTWGVFFKLQLTSIKKNGIGRDD